MFSPSPVPFSLFWARDQFFGIPPAVHHWEQVHLAARQVSMKRMPETKWSHYGKWCHTQIFNHLLPFYLRWPCKPIEMLHTSQILAVRYWESLWWKKDWTNASTWWKQRCQEPVKQQTHIKNCKNALQKMAKHRCCWTPLDKWNSYSAPLQPCPVHSSWARLCGVVAVE